MAIKPKDIYDGRKKKRSWGTIITVAAIVLTALIIGLFYGLRARCVYDEAGNAHIVFPFTEEAKTFKELKAQQNVKKAENTPPPLSEVSTAAPEEDAASEGSAPTDNVSPQDGTPTDIPEPGSPIIPEDTAPREGTEPEAIQ